MPPILSASLRFLKAVGALGEKSPYNNLTWFEAPVAKMPNAELGEQALKLWEELNDAGKALRFIIENDDIDTIASLLERFKDQDYTFIHATTDEDSAGLKKGFSFCVKVGDVPVCYNGDTIVAAINKATKP